jgi:hypothetical protein
MTTAGIMIDQRGILILSLSKDEDASFPARSVFRLRPVK